MRALTDFPDAHLRIFDRPTRPAPNQFHDVFLIGICGTGMGSLAGLFQQAGYAVRGSDSAAYPPMSTRLAALGIEVATRYDPANLQGPPELVVVGNACTPTHVEAAYARESGLPQVSLPEALAHYFIGSRRSLVIAGTHGKTTTTGMLIHTLQSAGRDPGFLVGGVSVGGGAGYAIGSSDIFVVEGDEYDSAYFDKRPKFLHYRPSCAAVTSLEFDHADIYAGPEEYHNAFEDFVRLVPDNGLLALNRDDAGVRALASASDARVRFYGLQHAKSDLTAENICFSDDRQCFELVVDDAHRATVKLQLTGRHNVSNALAAATIALEVGLNPEQIAVGLSSFAGMKRRQEIRGEAAGVTVVDDFAHHPTAVRETIAAARARWPDRRIIAVFEPRSNSSRRKVFQEAYVVAFSGAHGVYFGMPPFRHNDRKEDFMDIGAIQAGLRRRGVEAVAPTDFDSLFASLTASLRSGDVALIMSNGSFSNIHQLLLDHLRQQHADAPRIVLPAGATNRV